MSRKENCLKFECIFAKIALLNFTKIKIISTFIND